MTRFAHDQFAKDYLEELLSPLGEVKAPREVRGEVRQIDVWFSPAPQSAAEAERIGLLGRLAQVPSLFEPFRNAAQPNEICHCLLKLLEVRGEVLRQAKREQTRLNEEDFPQLWILTPTASEEILSGFGARVDEANWLPGIYFLASYLRTALVVIHQLPCIQETLWLRMLGRGRVREQAIDQLEALPVEHPFRANVLLLLSSLRSNLEVSPELEEEDRELIMRLSPRLLQQLEDATQQGLQQGRLEGQLAAELALVRRLLTRRLGVLPVQLDEQIGGLSVAQLSDLAEALLDFSSVADLAAWLEEN